jgi:hypothetical protein
VRRWPVGQRCQRVRVYWRAGGVRGSGPRDGPTAKKRPKFRFAHHFSFLFFLFSFPDFKFKFEFFSFGFKSQTSIRCTSQTPHDAQSLYSIYFCFIIISFLSIFNSSFKVQILLKV